MNGRVLAVGAITGTASWVLGYLVTVTAASGRVQGATEGPILGVLAAEGASSWQIGGLVYFNAHGVAHRVPGVGDTPAGAENYLAGTDPSLQLLGLVPIALLVVAGLTVATVTTRPRRPSTGALVGGSVATGYLLATAAGMLSIAVTVDGGTVRPDPIPALAIAGFLYPAVFGALGGVLASLEWRE